MFPDNLLARSSYLIAQPVVLNLMYTPPLHLSICEFSQFSVAVFGDFHYVLLRIPVRLAQPFALFLSAARTASRF